MVGALSGFWRGLSDVIGMAAALVGGIAMLSVAHGVATGSSLACHRAAAGVFCELGEESPVWRATPRHFELQRADVGTQRVSRRGLPATSLVLALNSEMVGAADPETAATRLNELLAGKLSSVALDPLHDASYGGSLMLASIGVILSIIGTAGLWVILVAEPRAARKHPPPKDDWVDEALGRKR